MRLEHYFRRAASHPPHIAAAKAVGLLRRTLRSARDRRRDLTRATYADAGLQADAKLLRYLDPLPEDALAASAEPRRLLARRHLAHRFDLLGSGWLEARYGVAAPGLEGHAYGPDPAPQTDPQGDWLAGHVTRANLDRSQQLWRRIAHPYWAIDWQRDRRSGFRWDGRLSSRDIVFGDVPGADIKQPWELGRLQHLPLFALCYASAVQGLAQFDDPERYAVEFRNQLLDFVASNGSSEDGGGGEHAEARGDHHDPEQSDRALEHGPSGKKAREGELDGGGCQPGGEPQCAVRT